MVGAFVILVFCDLRLIFCLRRWLWVLIGSGGYCCSGWGFSCGVICWCFVGCFVGFFCCVSVPWWSGLRC